MKMFLHTILGTGCWMLVTVFGLVAAPSTAQVPEMLNYQGRLSDGAGLVNTNLVMVVRLHPDPVAVGELYAETQRVAVVDGLYTFALGASNPVPGALHAALVNNGVWLETIVNGSPLAPREQVRASAYALTAAGVTNDAITSLMIRNGAVDTDELADESITAAKIADGEVGSTQLNTADVDTRYVNVDGDTMIGALDLPADGFAVGGDQLTAANGNVGIGLSSPGESLHIENGNMLINSAGEQEIRFRNTSLAHSPAFRVGRIQSGGDGAPNFRVLYSDDTTVEGPVFVFDSKGIVASVKTNVGAHFEGFIKGDTEPLFRLNSYPAMQLELGPGGTNLTDVIVKRDAGALEIALGGARALRVEPAVETPNLIGGAAVNHAVTGFSGVVIGGGMWHKAAADYATIAGGWTNEATGKFSAIGGGERNLAGGESAVVVGGRFSWAHGAASIAGGEGCRAIGAHSVALGLDNFNYSYASGIFSGDDNVVTGTEYAVIAGGQLNRILEATETSAILGGFSNCVDARAQFAVVIGGRGNVAGGTNSLAAGRRAKTRQPGTFVWADFSNFDFESTTNDEFSVRAVGGTRFVSGIDEFGTVTSGVHLASGSGAWTALSDRNAKENIAPVNPGEILEKVAGLPVSTWNYKTQNPAIRHLGPMAQDFHAAFGLGETETGIGTLDADGVALAAIQALYQRSAELERRVVELEAKLRAK